MIPILLWIPLVLSAEIHSCRNIQIRQDPIRQERPATRVHQCEDGTFSFPQPDSTGIGGWNGQCGPTAAANAMLEMCGRAIDPKIISRIAVDRTPGTRPGTLTMALNQLVEEGGCPKIEWTQWQYRQKKMYFKSIRETLSRFPGARVLALLQWDRRTLHWVTLSKLEGDEDTPDCFLTYQHWGRQEKVQCDKFYQKSHTKLFGKILLHPMFSTSKSGQSLPI